MRLIDPRLAAALLCAGLAALTAAPAASADSIVYIDGGNVWSAQPDGSGKVRLTDGGDWHSPTQSDDGTIAAAQGAGGPIVVMAPDGRPLRTITTPPAKSADGGTFAPNPSDLSFSPDGSKIAYAYYAYSCPVASTCGSIQRSTFYTRADVTEATPHSEWGNQFSVGDPEWVTNTRTLVHGGYGSQVSIDDLGPGDYSQTPWIVPENDMGDSEASRDGRRLAATFDYGDNTRILFLAINGDVRTETPPAQPDVACETTTGDAMHGDPSWSPDSQSIAIQSSAGIEVTRFTAFGPGDCAVAPTTILTPTGSSPDWGPAEPPAKPWTPPASTPTGSSTGTPPGDGGSTPDGPGQSENAFALTSARATAKALRKGAKVRVRVPGAGRVVVRLLKGRRLLTKGSARATAAGHLAVRLAKLRGRKLRAARGKLTVLATFTPHHGAPVTVKRTLRIR